MNQKEENNTLISHEEVEIISNSSENSKVSLQELEDVRKLLTVRTIPN